MFCVGVLLIPAQALGRNPRMARIRACTAASPAAKQICTSGFSSKSKRMSSVKGKAGPSVTNKSNIHCILSFQALHKSIFGVPFRVFMCFLFTSYTQVLKSFLFFEFAGFPCVPTSNATAKIVPRQSSRAYPQLLAMSSI